MNAITIDNRLDTFSPNSLTIPARIKKRKYSKKFFIKKNGKVYKSI